MRKFFSSARLIAGAFMAAITIGGIVNFPALAENSDINARRATERTTFSDDEIRCKEPERAAQGCQPRPIATHHCKRHRRGVAACCQGAREIGDDEPFRPVSHPRQCERTTGCDVINGSA